MAAPWLTVHFCRQSMDYHMVVYMSGHKIRKMCNPRPITLHEIHMSPSLFRNLLTPGFSFPTLLPAKVTNRFHSQSPSVKNLSMDSGSEQDSKRFNCQVIHTYYVTICPSGVYQSCYFDQYFWKCTKKALLTTKNGQNGVFGGQ